MKHCTWIWFELVDNDKRFGNQTNHLVTDYQINRFSVRQRYSVRAASVRPILSVRQPGGFVRAMPHGFIKKPGRTPHGSARGRTANDKTCPPSSINIYYLIVCLQICYTFSTPHLNVLKSEYKCVSVLELNLLWFDKRSLCQCVCFYNYERLSKHIGRLRINIR